MEVLQSDPRRHRPHPTDTCFEVEELADDVVVDAVSALDEPGETQRL